MNQPERSISSLAQLALLVAADGYAAMLLDAPLPSSVDLYGLASEASQSSGSTGVAPSRSSK